MVQLLPWSIVLLSPYSSVLAGGTFPGPLITARKVRGVIHMSRHLNSSHNRQGDPFSVNVINNLKNGTMDLVTAIVSVLELCFVTPEEDLTNFGYLTTIALARYHPTHFHMG